VSGDVDGPTLVSVGYEGWVAPVLVARLHALGVSTVVDVRLNPTSRKPGFSKRALRAGLARVDVGYVHLPALGNPPDNRAGFRAGSSAARRRFVASLGEPAATAALEALEELTHSFTTVAVLCYEADHNTCHRACVIEAVQERRPGITLVRV